MYKCGPNIIYLSALNSIASFSPRIVLHDTVVCTGCQVQVAVVEITNAVMFSVIQSNLSRVMMILNCIVLVPDLDLGREIKYSGTFRFPCPCRQMSDWQPQLRPDRFLTHPFLFIVSNYYTIQHCVAWVSESVVK